VLPTHWKQPNSSPEEQGLELSPLTPLPASHVKQDVAPYDTFTADEVYPHTTPPQLSHITLLPSLYVLPSHGTQPLMMLLLSARPFRPVPAGHSDISTHADDANETSLHQKPPVTVMLHDWQYAEEPSLYASP